jgi:acyl-CoA reductase-like NAD-dependent aldehyde dehydrogenase
MLEIRNPATGALIRELAEDDAQSVAAKFKEAQQAQAEWAHRPLSARLSVLQAFRTLVEARAENLARILTQETGKPMSQSRNELKGVLGRVSFFLENSAAVLAEEKVHVESNPHLEERISWDPLGVIANISAWNYPWFVGSNVFVPALITGNAVLYKPSEFASLTGLAIAELLHESGIPQPVFACVLGGPGAGSALLTQPLNGVFFTGSYATGQKIATAASQRLMKMQLELGGKDPVYVCDDVDPKAAALGLADGAFYNNGQSCCSVERLYVHAKVHDAFVEAFTAEVKSYAMGDPSLDATYLGPLARPAQIAVLERQAKDALAKGATLRLGGKRGPGPGAYFEPTVFTGVHHGMELMREETFGPMIGIQRVEDDAEAIRLMNDTEYGLTAGVYTQEAARARSILAQVRAGSVYWNCCDRVSPRLPWSGRGHSGLGTVLSKYGILTFVQPKAWHLKSN